MRVVLATMPNSVPGHKDLNGDLDRLSNTYESLGVEVLRYCPGPQATPDSAFLRDVFLWTPFKFVLPQLMAKESRRWEVAAFRDMFFPSNDPIRGSEGSFHQLPDGMLECADVLYTTRRHAIIGVGKRTSDVGEALLVDWFEYLDEYFTHHTVYLPDWHDQHLLGLLNIVQGDRFFIDQRVWEECEGSPPDWLEDAIVLPHEEYSLKHTNFVCFQDNVVINSACKLSIKILESRQAFNVIPVDIPALVANGGGVACSTGIWCPNA